MLAASAVLAGAALALMIILNRKQPKQNT